VLLKQQDQQVSELYIQKNKDWNASSTIYAIYTMWSELYIQKNKDWNTLGLRERILERVCLNSISRRTRIETHKENTCQIGHKGLNSISRRTRIETNNGFKYAERMQVWTLYPEEQGLKPHVSFVIATNSKSLNSISRRTRIETRSNPLFQFLKRRLNSISRRTRIETIQW